MLKSLLISNYMFKKEIVFFSIKLFFIYLLFLITLYLINFNLNNFNLKPIHKIYLKGLISNPEVFYQTSLYFHNNGNYDKALIDIQLAMGLINYKCINENKKICELYQKIKKSSVK